MSTEALITMLSQLQPAKNTKQQRLYKAHDIKTWHESEDPKTKDIKRELVVSVAPPLLQPAIDGVFEQDENPEVT